MKKTPIGIVLEKSLTYRVIVIFANFVLLFFVFGEPLQAGAVTILRNMIQAVLYVLHEELWKPVAWGKAGTGRILKRRSLAKASIFRLAAIVIDMLILTLFAGQALAAATGTTLLITVINTVIFYLHERVWLHTRRQP